MSVLFHVLTNIGVKIRSIFCNVLIKTMSTYIRVECVSVYKLYTHIYIMFCIHIPKVCIQLSYEFNMTRSAYY